MIRRAVLLLGALAIGLVAATPARALTAISPILEITAAPGDEQRGVVKLYNETDRPVALTASVEAYVSRDDEGNAVAVAPTNTERFLSWITLDTDELVLQPGDIGIVPFTVQVPSSATPGGYYAVLYWSERNDPISAGTAVGLRGQVGHILLLKITGELVESAVVKNFSVQSADHLPIRFQASLGNTGNIHLQPSGTIEITNWSGRVASFPFNPTNRVLLPGDEREFGWQLGQDSFILSVVFSEFKYRLIGPQTARLLVSYADGQSPLVQEVTFIYWPIRSIVVVLLIAATFGFSFRISVKKKRKSN